MARKQRAYVAVLVDNGASLGIAEQGEPGFYPTDYPTVATYDEAARWADEANARLGLTADDAARIVFSSIAAQHGRGFRY